MRGSKGVERAHLQRDGARLRSKYRRSLETLGSSPHRVFSSILTNRNFRETTYPILFVDGDTLLYLAFW